MVCAESAASVAEFISHLYDNCVWLVLCWLWFYCLHVMSFTSFVVLFHSLVYTYYVCSLSRHFPCLIIFGPYPFSVQFHY